MIVPSMTEQEIREELLKDLADLDKPMERFRKNFRSKVLKSYKFPVKTSYDCKSVKRKNLFVVTFTADKRGQHDNPNISMYCIYERKEGKYAAVYQPMTHKITIYAPHFFRRYQERILKDYNLPMLEIIKEYFRNCWGLTCVEIDENLETTYQCFEGHYNDEVIDFVSVTAGGYCFGEKHGNVSIIKTIISEEMLSEKQKTFFYDLKKICDNIQIDYSSKGIRLIETENRIRDNL